MNLHTVHCPIILNQHRARIPLGTCTHAGYFSDARHVDRLENYQIITPEVDGGYWWVYGHPDYPDYPAHGWDCMDYLYKYALDKQKTMIGYHLRWWFPNTTVQPVDIAAWITEAMTMYPKIIEWIVLNEAWWEDWATIPMIPESCEIARKVRPDAVLWYNGLLFQPYEQQQALDLVARGLVDGISIQMHHNLYTDLSVYLPLLEQLKARNVRWRVSELDVVIPNTTYESLRDQAECYRQALELVWQYGGESLITWGIADCVSWQSKYFPLPFDVEYKPKPAWDVLTEAV